MESLGSVLEGLLRETGIQKELTLYRLIEHWQAVVGPQIASHTAPQTLRFHTLTLGVDSAPWMNQLLFFKKEMIEKTNRFLGKPLLKEICFRMMPIPPAKKKSSEQKPSNQHPPLEPEQAATLSKGIDAIHDAALGKTIQEALARYFEETPSPLP